MSTYEPMHPARAVELHDRICERANRGHLEWENVPDIREVDHAIQSVIESESDEGWWPNVDNEEHWYYVQDLVVQRLGYDYDEIFPTADA